MIINHERKSDNIRKAREYISPNVMIKKARLRRLVQITDRIMIMNHERISDNNRKAKEHIRQGEESNLSNVVRLLSSLKTCLFLKKKKTLGSPVQTGYTLLF